MKEALSLKPFQILVRDKELTNDQLCVDFDHVTFFLKSSLERVAREARIEALDGLGIALNKDKTGHPEEGADYWIGIQEGKAIALRIIGEQKNV